jgi:hypothetical protein
VFQGFLDVNELVLIGCVMPFETYDVRLKVFNELLTLLLE